MTEPKPIYTAGRLPATTLSELAELRKIVDNNIDLRTALVEIKRMIVGAKSSPDYPDNLPALLDMIQETIEGGIYGDVSGVSKTQ